MNTAFRILIGAMICITLIIAIACSKKVKVTGFLSDYSRLKPVNGSLRYIDMQRLGSYSRFIIDPVVVRLYQSRHGYSTDRSTLTALANYMHNAIVNSIRDRYMIVSQSGPELPE